MNHSQRPPLPTMYEHSVAPFVILLWALLSRIQPQVPMDVTESSKTKWGSFLALSCCHHKLFISPSLLVPNDPLLQMNHFCEIPTVWSIEYFIIAHSNSQCWPWADTESLSSLISVSFLFWEQPWHCQSRHSFSVGYLLPSWCWVTNGYITWMVYIAFVLILELAGD